MLPECQQYTLVGFGAEVDWRPLRFVKPIPKHRVCGACGLVRKRTAFLPCMHVLCEACYEQCTHNNARACPLDDLETRDEDVEWRDCPAEDLLRREVVCWNEEYGCGTMIPASEASWHFLRECGYHSVSCSHCFERILCRDICSHLRSDCCATKKPLETKEQVPSCCKDHRAYINHFAATFEKKADEIMAFLQVMVADNTIYQERLNKLYLNINTLKGTLNEQLATVRLQFTDMFTKSMRDVKLSNEELQKALTTQNDSICSVPGSIKGLEEKLKAEMANATSGSRDHVTQTATAIKAELRENNEAALKKITHVLRHNQLQVTVINFCVPGFHALIKKALTTGQADILTEKVYLRGYCIKPGITIRKDGELLKLYVALMLYKGDMDDFLEWPFEPKVKLTIMHPKDGRKLVLEVERCPSVRHYQKPSQLNNEGVHIDSKFLDVNHIIKDGYAETDALFIQWGLLP